MKVVAVIQARLGSTRFPRKVLRPLAGRPILWHVLHRLRQCRTVDEIVLATTTDPSDDALIDFANANEITVVRGPIHNVLERFRLAAAMSQPDIVVRVTGDSPLVDPDYLDQMVETLASSEAEHCGADPGVPCIHEGFSAMRVDLLHRLAAEVGSDPAAQEHVSGYLQKDRGFARSIGIPVPPEHQMDAKISVDTPADLHLMERLYDEAGVQAGDITIDQVVALLKRDPALRALNTHIARKGVQAGGRRILIRVDGSARVGLGHIHRVLPVANRLRDEHACGITLAIRDGAEAVRLAEEAGHAVSVCPTEQDEDSWFRNLIGTVRPDAILLDVRSDLDRSIIQDARKSGILIATLDDPTDRRLDADLAFYPPVPQVDQFDWNGFDGELLVGWEWMPVRDSVAPVEAPAGDRPHILVMMGASDPGHHTPKIVDALRTMKTDHTITVLLGPAFPHNPAEVERAAADHGRTRIIRDSKQPADHFADVDLAIISFGMTSYELALARIPCLYLAASESHAMASSVFERLGVGLLVGLHDQLSSQHLSTLVEGLLQDDARLQAMRASAAQSRLGNGATTIAAHIIRVLNVRGPVRAMPMMISTRPGDQE